MKKFKNKKRESGWYKVRKYEEWVWAFFTPYSKMWSYDAGLFYDNFWDEIDETSRKIELK